MISTGMGIALCGKGEAAERVNFPKKFALGRDENIGATVIAFAVLRYWIF